MSDEKNKVVLTFADLISLVNESNDEFDNFLIGNKITSGRDFRRKLRKIRDTSTDVIKLSLALEKKIREDKKEKKNAS
jgi:hypothetical protein